MLCLENFTLQRTIKKNINRKQLYPYEKPKGFPLESLEAFEEFGEDVEKQLCLKEYLTSIGGHRVKDTLNQFMKGSLCDSFTKNFSWTGKKVAGHEELRPLHKTQLAKMHCGCVAIYPSYRIELLSQDVYRIQSELPSNGDEMPHDVVTQQLSGQVRGGDMRRSWPNDTEAERVLMRNCN
ncbi:uncharacterized protein LOC105691142 [Athalia rosae]|uniref:uncharacterized protein LOC105691142 n=1 Tax=Athalia rosae TaxID=37344 RepID=UPI0020340E58|nr:uncharacterized protein LOC105691142 [Athalia rosae]XP_048515909.1 uncharacterized protein LOC105691142 [Athalia rosae]